MKHVKKTRWNSWFDGDEIDGKTKCVWEKVESTKRLIGSMETVEKQFGKKRGHLRWQNKETHIFN